MSVYEYSGCDKCRYVELGCEDFPCFDCKHNIPVSDPAYDFAPDNYMPLYIETEANNPVNHPSHYNQGNIECIDAMVAVFGAEATAIFCHLNAFKYVWRMEDKNGLEDTDKAIWYLNKYKELKGIG